MRLHLDLGEYLVALALCLKPNLKRNPDQEELKDKAGWVGVLLTFSQGRGDLWSLTPPGAARVADLDSDPSKTGAIPRALAALPTRQFSNTCTSPYSPIKGVSSAVLAGGKRLWAGLRVPLP